MTNHDFPGSDEAFRHAQEGKIHEALACHDKALQSNPKNDVILNNKAIALISLGRYEESLACSKRAISINPYEAGVWINKGIALERLERLPELSNDALNSLIRSATKIQLAEFSMLQLAKELVIRNPRLLAGLPLL